jgi:hypothetical protein
MIIMVDRQEPNFHSYKNVQDSQTLNQRKINKPTEP